MYKAVLFPFCWVLVSIVWGSSTLLAQAAMEDNTWRQLSDVKFERIYNELMGMDYPTPTFGESVKQMEGTKITVTGYVIPLDVEAELYVLSANPYASCFFCGGAGPETVIELVFKKKLSKRFKTDEVLTLSGILRLNATDLLKLNYIMEEAVIVK